MIYDYKCNKCGLILGTDSDSHQGQPCNYVYQTEVKCTGTYELFKSIGVTYDKNDLNLSINEPPKDKKKPVSMAQVRRQKNLTESLTKRKKIKAVTGDTVEYET